MNTWFWTYTQYLPFGNVPPESVAVHAPSVVPFHCFATSVPFSPYTGPWLETTGPLMNSHRRFDVSPDPICVTVPPLLIE